MFVRTLRNPRFLSSWRNGGRGRSISSCCTFKLNFLYISCLTCWWYVPLFCLIVGLVFVKRLRASKTEVGHHDKWSAVPAVVTNGDLLLSIPKTESTRRNYFVDRFEISATVMHVWLWMICVSFCLPYVMNMPSLCAQSSVLAQLIWLCFNPFHVWYL